MKLKRFVINCFVYSRLHLLIATCDAQEVQVKYIETGREKHSFRWGKKKSSFGTVE